LARYHFRGDQPNNWENSDEFEMIARNWKGIDQCVSRAYHDGVMLDFPFGDHRVSVVLGAGQLEPPSGNGLLGNLRLPIFGDMKNIADRCASLNLMETMWADIPQFGCWHPFPLSKDSACPQFSIFVPNALYRKGIASMVMVWLHQRIRWVIEGEFATTTRPSA
jgi:hypothetical protein